MSPTWANIDGEPTMNENRTIFTMAKELVEHERAIRELKMEIQDELGVVPNSPFVQVNWAAIRREFRHEQ